METVDMDSDNIKKYNGTNYKQWAFDMRQLLMGANLWDIVEGKETCPASGDEEINDWNDRRNGAFIEILDALTDDMGHEYGYGRFKLDPVNLWKQIETDYVAQVKRDSYLLRRELSTTTLEDCGSVDFYVSKIQTAIEKYNLANADSHISEDEHRFYLLHGMPQYEFEDWYVTIKPLFDKMCGPDEIITMLREREKELQKKKGLKPDQPLYSKGATKANETANIFTLSTELLLQIIEDPGLQIEDLVSLSFSCKIFRRIIKRHRCLAQWLKLHIHNYFNAKRVIDRIIDKRVDTSADDYLLYALRAFTTYEHVCELRENEIACERESIYSTTAATPGMTPITKAYWIEALRVACFGRDGLPVFRRDPSLAAIPDALAVCLTRLAAWHQDWLFSQWLLPHERFASSEAIERGDDLALRLLLITGWASTPRCLQQAASKVLKAIDDESVDTSAAIHTVQTIIDSFTDAGRGFDLFLMCLIPINDQSHNILLDCSLCPPTSKVAATLLKMLLEPSAECGAQVWHRADLLEHAFISALGKAIEYINIGESHDARVLQAWLGSPSVRDVLLPANHSLEGSGQLLQDALRVGGPHMLRELLCIWLPFWADRAETPPKGTWKLKSNLHGIDMMLQANPPPRPF
jgi:hypothetical protein